MCAASRSIHNTLHLAKETQRGAPSVKHAHVVPQHAARDVAWLFLPWIRAATLGMSRERLVTEGSAGARHQSSMVVFGQTLKFSECNAFHSFHKQVIVACPEISLFLSFASGLFRLKNVMRNVVLVSSCCHLLFAVKN